MPTYKKRKQLRFRSRSQTRSMKGGYGFQILYAIADDDVDTLRQILEQKIPNYDFSHELNEASKKGNYSIVKLLVENGADVNSKYENDLPLHAVFNFGGQIDYNENRVELIKYLIQHTNDINMPNRNGLSPLHKALLMPATSDQILEILELLYQNGADINKVTGAGRGSYSNGKTPVRVAMMKGHSRLVEIFFIPKGANVDAEKDILLLDVASSGHIETLEFLLQRGANVNIADADGNTPIHRAVIRGHYATMERLLQGGANMNVVNKKGQTLLHSALSTLSGVNLDIVKFIIDHGADIDGVDNDGNTPLHIASGVFRIAGAEANKIVAFILDRTNNSINAINKNGDTPLHIACGKGYFNVVELLVQGGANIHAVNGNGDTSLHIACGKGYFNVVELLVQGGANIHAVNGNGQTTLHSALNGGDINTVKFLIDSGVDVDKIDNDKNTSLHIASNIIGEQSEMRGERSKKIVKIILKFTKNSIDAINKNGDTPLILACRRGYDIVADILLQAGADANIPDKDGNTPLNTATLLRFDNSRFNVENVSAMLVNVLVDYTGIEDNNNEGEHGPIIDVNKANAHGNTPLHHASQNGNVNIVEKLIYQGGILLNEQNKDGNTPLHMACKNADKNDYTVIVDMLLKKEDIEIDIENNEGKTPLHLASEKGVEAIVNLLLDNGARITDSIKSVMDNFHPAIKTLLTRPSEPWKGWSRSDSIVLDQMFENPKKFSLCPFCLKIAYHSKGCMYMTHDCRRETEGGYYHERLYNIFKNSAGFVSWCTICGRPCKGHHHCVLGLPDKSSNDLARDRDGNIIEGPPFEADCSNQSGGGGPLEKIARYRRLREIALELTKHEKITRVKAMDMLIEEAWKAPLFYNKYKIKKIQKDKKWNFNHNLFPENEIPAQPEAVQTHASNVLRPESNASDPNLQPVYHPNGLNSFYSGEEGPAVQFRHRKSNGEINAHENDYVSLEGLKLFLDDITQNFSQKRFGFCYKYPNCDARLYPSELQILKDHEHQLPDLEEGELDALLAKYREKFNAKFSAAQGAAAQGGGMNGEPESIFVEAKHAMCAIPPKKGGRKTRRRQRVAKNKRATRKY